MNAGVSVDGAGVGKAEMAAVQAYLKALRLPAMAQHLASTLRETEVAGHNPLEFLRALLEAELGQRKANQTRRLIQQAKFPYAKSLDEFDFTAVPSLNKAKVLGLARCEFIVAHQSVILMGNAGTGKTHLAIALGREACRHGYKTRFYTAAGLVNELLEAQDTRSLSRLEKRWRKLDLIVLDELGYIPFSKAGAQLLFQFISLAYERSSLLVTTNLDFERWTEVFGDAELTAALLDRLTHKASILAMNGESYRFRETMRLKQQEDS